MTIASGSIHSDEHNADLESVEEFDAEAAFLKRFEDGDSPSDDAEGEGTETEEAGSSEGSEETEATEKSEADPTIAGDDALVTVKVGEEEHKIAVRDLKRLWGQEKSLTQKSQEVAEAHQRANAEGERAVVILDRMLQNARKEFEPLSRVDFALAAQRLPEDAYRQLREDHQAAYAKVKFLEQEADGYLNVVRENRSKQLQAELRACDDALAADPETKGWDAAQRSEVTQYAVSQGMPAAVAQALAMPAALKLIRKAMLFDKGTKAVAEKVKQVPQAAPKRVMKPGAASSTTVTDKAKDALKRLHRTGSQDDAAAAFAARWTR